MKLDFSRVQKLLKAFDFPKLFREELGWEPFVYNLSVSVNGETYLLQTLAQKHGFYTLRLHGKIPGYAVRRKIEAQVAKSYFEHLIIFTDPAQTIQVWQWVKHEPGRPAASRETIFRREESGQALIQKLEYLAVTLEEEEQLTILGVTERVKTGFDVEKVTKKFYERFKDEHTAFLKFVYGIPEEGLQRWYVSVTLNRLMFVYFIQKKGFLDGKQDYLRKKLAESQKKGQNRFYSDFLCPLFFNGFATKNHTPETVRLLGKVPYLNGGIFSKHQIEQKYGQKSQIPDAAFERLFTFFDLYQWHLDERPIRKDNEINPDVLGYIFEKYINQKQMGAYYT
ncbi:MAG: SAM-dependent methyltransferase, partial [Chlorobiales bacterium]|nr:SAM-dependent methyltransferase [Chlorobiales bacterium]